MPIFKRFDPEQEGKPHSNGFLTGLVIGVLLYIFFVAYSTPDFFVFRSQEQAFDQGEQSPQDYKPEEVCRVERIVDGDTIVVVSEGKSVRVRFIGVDTPETVKPNSEAEPFGAEATQYTANRIAAFNNIVLLRSDGDLRDRYGRRLSMVYLGRDGTSLLNEELIRHGLAKAEPQYHYSEAMKVRFQKAENEAKAEGVGIWSLPQKPDEGKK